MISAGARDGSGEVLEKGGIKNDGLGGSYYVVTPAKAGVQKAVERLDSRWSLSASGGRE